MVFVYGGGGQVNSDIANLTEEIYSSITKVRNHEDTRDFYALEELWGDATTTQIESSF